MENIEMTRIRGSTEVADDFGGRYGLIKVNGEARDLGSLLGHCYSHGFTDPRSAAHYCGVLSF